MTLRLHNKWVWDFWLTQDGPDYHIFYLQAPRSLQDENLRHWNVSVGHAVSQDLCNWETMPDALRPGPPQAWDDYTTWTGSIIEHDGLWYFFYTGSNRAEKGLIQRVGLATSTDLITWEKHPDNPLIEADPQWYELLDLNHWHDQTWRDPWVFRHSEEGDFHAFITARANHGPPDGRGVIAHARSSDLVEWEVLPPVTEPGEFGHMEVPQLVEIRGRYYLIFCAAASVHSAARRERTALQSVTGTHYLVAESRLGPFHYTSDEFMVGDAVGSFYAGKLAQDPDGAWCFLAWRQFTPDGTFVGELSDPMPMTVDSAGNLSVGWREYL